MPSLRLWDSPEQVRAREARPAPPRGAMSLTRGAALLSGAVWLFAGALHGLTAYFNEVSSAGGPGLLLGTGAVTLAAAHFWLAWKPSSRALRWSMWAGAAVAALLAASGMLSGELDPEMTFPEGGSLLLLGLQVGVATLAAWQTLRARGEGRPQP